jgi:hypothetical protein
MEENQSGRQNLRWWLAFLVLVIVFSLAYAQSPLFTSNQNQYFFYGMARAGFGDLDQDWLYSTNDIVPVFSFLVYLTYSIFHTTWVFYLWYAVIFGIYLYSMYGIIAHIFKWENSIRNLLLFGVAVILLHSAVLRYAISSWISPAWEYLFEGGVAGQRVLGDVFQPSSFGVLFLLSIYLFLKERHYWAVAVSALAAVIHPTYLLSAAILTATYGFIRLYETKKFIEFILIGLLALVLVSGITIYTAAGFLGVDSGLAAQANDITINYRQPHHMIIANWFDLRVVIKIIILIVALFLVARQRIFWVLLGPSIVVIGLTVLQAIIQNPALAMLFPWRFSVILVPLSTMIIVGNLLNESVIQAKLQIPAKLLYAISAILLIFCTTTGIYKFITSIWQRESTPKYEMMTMIRDHYQTGQIVVVPLKWQEFRLETGIPIVVEYKAGPQSAPDIVEWYERVQQVDHLYAGLPYGEGCMRWEYLQYAYGATHLVLPNNLPAEPDCMNLLFSNEEFSYYEAIAVK